MHERKVRSKQGFTLIELLVVVAIIALLISILLPSLSKARAQARTTLCGSRIGQLFKATLIYAEDFGETPPFLGVGWEDYDQENDKVWPLGSGMTRGVWKRLENWLMPDMMDYWATGQPWPDKATPRNGSLFPYTRFENLYRCPEFERAGNGQKSQEFFNYTRTLLGRKWFVPGEPEDAAGSAWADGSSFGSPGPIMRLSQIYAPGRLEMFYDERWDHHCAAPITDFAPTPGSAGKGALAGISGGWMCADPIFFPLGNEIGQYHGAKMANQLLPSGTATYIPAVQRGSSAFYDGHVELELDPLPDRDLKSFLGPETTAFLGWMSGSIFNQRGLTSVDYNP
jgi:prepilin-type N-terminal cleavage/methylation domain-containing protein